MINYHETWKVAILVPQLKKYDLDLVFENCRPVSKLWFVFKVREKAVVDQLFEHCADNAPLPTNQSSYDQFHSTETALVKVHNDILLNMDQQEATPLVLLDLSATFDPVNHETLIDILEFEFGVIGKALKWIKSFLSRRKQRVNITQELSNNYSLNCGVPQGSCRGPVCFLLYVSQLFQVINKRLPSSHGYSDDTHLYCSFRVKLQGLRHR